MTRIIFHFPPKYRVHDIKNSARIKRTTQPQAYISPASNHRIPIDTGRIMQLSESDPIAHIRYFVSPALLRTPL